MAIIYPLINGVAHDWSSCEISINNDIVLGIKEISYSDSLEPGEVRGTHAQRLARTRGTYKCEASIELYLEQANAFLAKLGTGFYETEFNIVVNFQDTGVSLIKDTIYNCKLKKIEKGGGGSDAITRKFDLDPTYLILNDQFPLKKMLK